MKCFACRAEIPLALIPDRNAFVACPSCGTARPVVWMTWGQWVKSCLARPAQSEPEPAPAAQKLVFGGRI